MITEEFKIEKKEKSEFPPLPENIYQAQLLDVNVEERPTYDTKNKPDNEKVMEKVLKFQFTLLNGTDMNADKEEFKNLRGRNIWENFVPTFLYIGKNGKNKLYQIVESLIRRELTQEEEATFTSSKINELVGMQTRIGIKNKAGKEGGVFSNIDTYYAVEQELTPLSEEEKEKARIKKEDNPEVNLGDPTPEELNNPSEGTPEHNQNVGNQSQMPNVSNIPF